MVGTKRAAALVGGVMVACALLIGAAPPAWAISKRTAQVVRVIDGDTFEIAGGAKIRVRNFDTPELRNYDCQEEKRLAQAARDTARELLQGRRVTLLVEGQDRYRRIVADVIVHRGGRQADFVELMVARGAGARWDYGHEPQPQWCGETDGAGQSVTWRGVLRVMLEELAK